VIKIVCTKSKLLPNKKEYYKTTGRNCKVYYSADCTKFYHPNSPGHFYKKSPEKGRKMAAGEQSHLLCCTIHSQPIFFNGIMPIIFGPRLVYSVRILQAWEGEREQYKSLLKAILLAALTAVLF